MSDTLPDIPLVANEYIDVYALSGIAVGKQIVIQNKSVTPIYIQEVAAQPNGTNLDGYVLDRWKTVIVTKGSTGAWVRPSSQQGAVTVQEV